MTDAIEVEGLRDTVRDLKRLGDETIPAKVRAANLEAAETVAAEARHRAPVRTGALRATIRATIRAAGQQSAAVVREGSARVKYAGFIDYGGTIRPKGTPITRDYKREGRIIYPALDAKSHEVVTTYEKKVQEALNDWR